MCFKGIENTRVVFLKKFSGSELDFNKSGKVLLVKRINNVGSGYDLMDKKGNDFFYTVMVIPSEGAGICVLFFSALLLFLPSQNANDLA